MRGAATVSGTVSRDERLDVVQCARCGHACSAESWRAQPASATLTRADLAGRIVGWPEDAVVEVRGCAACGGAIARRRRAVARG